MSEKLLNLKILQQHLVRAEEQAAEATLERLQRASAFREQEAAHKFNQERREEVRAAAARDAEWGREKYRPSMFVGTYIYYNENQECFCCQHAGIIAYGDTPSMACENFDHLWVFGR